MVEQSRPSRFGVALRVGAFAFLAYASLVILSYVLVPYAGLLAASVLSTFGAAALANSLAMRIYERRALADIGLHWNAASRSHLLWGLAGGAGAAVLGLAPSLVAGAAVLRPDPAGAAGWGPFLYLSLALLFGAIGEEMLFRGYGFQALVPLMGRFATLLPMGILFGLAHAGNLNAGRLGVLNTVLWGVLLGYAVLRTGDLWLASGLHFGWNFVLPLFGVNVSGFTMKVTGYVLEWRVADLWSGGAYGPEGGLLCTMVLAPLTLLIWRLPVRPQPHCLLPPPSDDDAG